MNSSARFLRSVVVLAVASGFLTMSTLQASAAPEAIKGPQNLTVSCNATIPKNGVTVHQAHTGDFKIKQNSTSPSSRSVVWAVDGAGNSLPSKKIGDGQTATWTDVLPGTYTVHVHRSGSANCNGIGLGDGNYNWDYTVTFDD